MSTTIVSGFACRSSASSTWISLLLLRAPVTSWPKPHGNVMNRLGHTVKVTKLFPIPMFSQEIPLRGWIRPAGRKVIGPSEDEYILTHLAWESCTGILVYAPLDPRVSDATKCV